MFLIFSFSLVFLSRAEYLHALSLVRLTGCPVPLQ